MADLPAPQPMKFRGGLSWAKRLAEKHHDDGTARQMREFQRQDSVGDMNRQMAMHREKDKDSGFFSGVRGFAKRLRALGDNLDQ